MQANLQPCLSGEALMRQKTVQRDTALLKQLISAPADIYQQLYLKTLHAVLELCQAIPQDITQSKPYSFMQNQLDLTITALKLRRGKLLPTNANSETIAEQEPLWTYALFSASLLYNVDRIQAVGHIELYKNPGEKLGLWHPVAGSLAEPTTYYRITAERNTLILDKKAFQSILIGKLIPTVALRWLAQYPAVFQDWQAVIVEQAQPNNPLQILIQQALDALNQHTTPKPTEQEDATPQKEQKTPQSKSNPTQEKSAQTEKTKNATSNAELKTKLTTALNEWLIEQIKTQDEKSPLCIRVEAGIFITDQALKNFQTTYASLGVFTQASHPFHTLLEKNTQKNTRFQYRSINLANKIRLSGVIVSQLHLCSTLDQQVVSKDWIAAESF